MQHSWAISLTIAEPFINKEHKQKSKKKIENRKTTSI